MEHHFNIELAKQFGILEAIIINNLEYWIIKNEANGENFFDGTYWTYNSVRAFNELFPYVSQRKIQTALKHLIEEEIIMTGNYNNSSYDRTLWYAFTKKGKSIMQKCKMDYANLLNGLCENVEPIPNINTNINNIKENTLSKDNVKRKVNKFVPPSFAEVQMYIEEKGYNVDAKTFYEYFTVSDWVDSKGNKVKNWKQKLITWNNSRSSNNNTNNNRDSVVYTALN